MIEYEGTYRSGEGGEETLLCGPGSESLRRRGNGISAKVFDGMIVGNIPVIDGTGKIRCTSYVFSVRTITGEHSN